VELACIATILILLAATLALIELLDRL